MRALLMSTVALVALSGVSHAQESVGRTAVVIEDVNGHLNDTVRKLVVKDDVHLDEQIVTQANSASDIVFFDGTELGLGENSNIVLSKFIYDPRPSAQKLSVNVTKGLFRFATGAFDKSSYRVNTPVATIGVRGTEFECSIARDDQHMLCQVTHGFIVVTDKQGATHEVPEGKFADISLTDVRMGDNRDFHDADFDKFNGMMRNAHFASNLGIPHDPHEHPASTFFDDHSHSGDTGGGGTQNVVVPDDHSHSADTVGGGAQNVVVPIETAQNVVVPIETSNVVSPNGLR